MPRPKSIAAIFVLLLTVRTFAQSTEHTILVNWNPIGAALCGHPTGTRNVTFVDTAGSSWSHLRVRMPLAISNPETGDNPPSPAIVSIAVNGAPVGDPVVVTNRSFVCGPYVTYEFTAESLPGYRAYQQNTFTVTIAGGYAGNSGEPAELTFRIEPRKFAFDLVPAMSQKVILHPHPNDTDLSPWQVVTNMDEKPRFRFKGAVTSNTNSLDADVWLRVIDPADPSQYLPQHLPDDNFDPLKKGVLMPAGCADASCRAAPGQPLQVRSTTAGVVEVELEATGRYAGDNYYVEASFDEAFTCATAGTNGANVCARSGVVTAWKRVFIEKRRMLKNGLFLADDANAGDTFIVTRGNHWFGNEGNNEELSKGEKIVIVHAPQLNRSDFNEGWYWETHTILSVVNLGNNLFRVNLGTKRGKIVIEEPLQYDYTIDSTDRNIGDGISKIATLTLGPADYFDAPMDLVTGDVFRDAFTENIILPDISTPGAFVPVPFLETTDEPTLQNLAEKWSSVVNPTLAPNHQLLIIASGNNPPVGGPPGDLSDGAGLTISQLPGRTSSFVFVDAIDQQVSGKSSNPLIMTWARKTAAHEIAHQWQTNGSIWQSVDPTTTKDHCPKTTKVWNDPSAYCLLASNDLNLAGSVAQRTNGIAGFHFLTKGNGTHSEYLEIRRRPDPFVP